MVRSIAAALASICVCGQVVAQSGWNQFGANAQHTALYLGQSQSASRIHWSAPMDDEPNNYVGAVFAHFASPLITPENTVLYSRRTTTQANGDPDFDNWSVFAVHSGAGQAMYSLRTDYSAPVVYPDGWTTIFPMTLIQLNSLASSRGGKALEERAVFNSIGVAIAGAGGSIFVRKSADSETSPTDRYIFYTTLHDFNANFQAYSGVKIITPLTCDGENNIYFGYQSTSTVPAALKLGTGGIAKVNGLTGVGSFRTIQSLGLDFRISHPAYSSAPALSLDGESVYFALPAPDGGTLAKFSTANLTLLAHVRMKDPTVPGAPALINQESSAAPTIGPDGHVFMGVSRYSWSEDHGILLQYDQNLNPANSAGKTFPPGSFGQDVTPSVVPASCVPSYKGASKYLLLCKYNNYDDNFADSGADGSNKTALVDPSSDSRSRDRQSGVPVMNEILTVLGPTKTNFDFVHPNARREWCINTAVVDFYKKGAILNSEDGRVYRWNFVNNSLTEAFKLQDPTVEAYTSTSIGPDGTIYAISNTILFAIGY